MVIKLARRVAVVAAAVSMAVGFAGCGSDTGQGQDSGQTSPGKSSSSGTAANGTGSPVRLTTASFLPATKKAVASKNSVRTSMRMVVAGQTITSSGVARFGDRPAMSMVMNSPAFSGEARVILVNDALYLSIPGQVPDGKYVKIAADADSPLAKSFRQSLDGLNPRKTFAAFDAGLRKVSYVGSETVDGLKVQHYKVTVDTRAALAAQGQPMTSGVPKTITYDIWLDSARLMRKVTFTLAGVSAVMTAKDYGKPVTVKAPPAADVITR
jgi:LppX_LprAFG lipoprotein